MTPPEKSAAELALSEMKKRLRDRPKEIPDHVLARLITELNKADEPVDAPADRPFSLLDELPTLPPERARALIGEEIGRLQAELDQYLRALEDLDVSTESDALPHP